MASAKIYAYKFYRHKAGVQWLKEGPWPQFVTSQPCGTHPWAAYTAPRDAIAAVDVHTTSVGSDGSDPGSILEVQSKAAGDRARDRARDELQHGSESPSGRQAKVQGPARRHPEAGLEPDTPMMLLRQGLGAQA